MMYEESAQEFLDRITLEEFHAAGLYLPGERERLVAAEWEQRWRAEAMRNAAVRHNTALVAFPYDQICGPVHPLLANTEALQRPVRWGAIGGAVGALGGLFGWAR